jgi:aspartate/methionine/tyrosine aminotransferase
MRPAPFVLERWFARHEFTAPLHACASDVEAPSMRELLDRASPATREAWDTLRLGYTEAPGHPRLRAAIAALYEDVEPDDVLVFAGAEEAIFAWANTQLGPGDHVVVVWPSYQSLHEVARAAGAEVSLLELRHEDGWALDLDALRALLRPETRAIVVNFPHNPTGAQLDPDAFEALLALDVPLFCDEVYRWCEHEGVPRLPAGAERGHVSLGVLSKTFALPGLRIGWVACRDRALLERLAAFKDYTTICSSAPSEILAIAALEDADWLIERTRGIVAPNLALADALIAGSDALEWVRPRGAPIGYPRLLHGDVDAFARDLLAEQGVLVLPGSVYGHAGDHFRIGLGRTDLPEALERMEAFLGSR